MAPLAGSQYHGSAQVITAPDGYRLSITVGGLQPGTRHRVNIHPGKCAEIDAGQGQELGFMTADASGSSTLETEYHSPYSVPAAGKVLTLHGDEGTDAALGHYVVARCPPETRRPTLA